MDPLNLFRINRQYIISLKAIDEMKMYNKARAIITLKPQATEQQIVSLDRSAAFKLWLADEDRILIRCYGHKQVKPCISRALLL